MLRPITLLPVALAAFALTCAAPVQADTLQSAAPGAKNLVTAGGYAAWASPAGDRWRLTVRRPDGTTYQPAVADFGAPPEPDIGSSGFNPERRLSVVYSRCEGASALAGCDAFQTDIASGPTYQPLARDEQKERKLAISSVNGSEASISLQVGGYAFVRRGGARVTGVFSWGGRGAPKRVTTIVARDVETNRSRVAYSYRSSAGFGLAIRRISLEGPVLVPVSGLDAEPRSVVLTRYRAGWLLGTKAFQTGRFGGSGDEPVERPQVTAGARDLPATVDSIAENGSVVTSYLDAEGVKAISPAIFTGG